MAFLGITVPQDVSDENDALPTAGESYLHGEYENAAGDADEFVPGVTDECPKCYGGLEKFFVASDSSRGEHEPVDRHRPLLAVCESCGYIPFKADLVTVYPERK